jgi:hypothetical protein
MDILHEDIHAFSPASRASLAQYLSEQEWFRTEGVEKSKIHSMPCIFFAQVLTVFAIIKQYGGTRIVVLYVHFLTCILRLCTSGSAQ